MRNECFGMLMALSLAACTGRGGPAPAPKARVDNGVVMFRSDDAIAQHLATDKVRGPTETELQLPGRLVWDEQRTVRVFSPFAGRVRRIFANPGDRVRPGQPLAEIFAPDFVQAQAEARKAAADLALANKAMERQRQLLEHGVAARKDAELSEGEAARARVEFDRASARLRAYGSAAEAGAFSLRSPVAGIVVDRALNPGQEVRPDQGGPPLFVVTDPTRLWLQLDASEADARQLKPGMALTIASNPFPEEAFAGEIRQVADYVDPSTRTVKLRADVANAQRTLRAEMYVTARVKLPAADATVDARAVYLSGVRRFVFVRVGAGRFARRAVRVGPERDGRMPVYAGLQEGEEVVVSGALFLEQIVAHAQ